MVSFQCDGCGDVVKKPKLPSHRCRSTFTCIDCSVTFQGRAWESHTSCMTEAEKFQKHIYQNKKGNNQNSQKNNKKADKNNNSNGDNAKKNDEKDDNKPVSLIDQLKKRKNEEVKEENEPKKQKSEEKKKDKKKKNGSDDWSSVDLDKDLSKNLKLALKHILKDGPISLRDARKKAIDLIDKHPQYKKGEDLKKAFEKLLKITLVDDTVTFL